MKTKFIILYIFVFSSFTINAQDTDKDSKTIENQFNKIYRKSSSYKKYKVINKNRFLKLKSDVSDSLKVLKTVIIEKENTLKNKNKKIESLYSLHQQTNKKLTVAISKENTISFFGIQISKKMYKIIIWVLIFLLLIGFILFVYKFNNSNVLTEEAKNNLLSVEREFDIFRKKSIKREQKLRRELLDQVNKPKK